eukprot:Blabericola_migrator_1__2707@NODE_176_length_11972_cov_72_986308_g153_i0_p3_GENE_NODE_176_length_11972_cov_72_986308_g153_i0NODE_176_length_11972_cov_72_986308_g153_i0_p3_ORF_typecomplete_len123_score12_85DUF4130/PF13566_6/0_17_NODE_176_length_11972_cov_72_986308_g153_i048385206
MSIDFCNCSSMLTDSLETIHMNSSSRGSLGLRRRCSLSTQPFQEHGVKLATSFALLLLIGLEVADRLHAASFHPAHALASSLARFLCDRSTQMSSPLERPNAPLRCFGKNRHLLSVQYLLFQ